MKDVDKRKIYDLVNILTSINLIIKITKGIYCLNGLASARKCVEEIALYKNLESFYKNDKSLGSITFCFISILKTFNKISQEKITKILAKNTNGLNIKSKTRRIYDICKILTAIGFITNLNLNKEIILKFNGIDKFIENIENIINSEKIDYESLRKNSKLKKHQSNFINNLTKMIAQTDLYKIDPSEIAKKRRTSSFDVTIIERFLKKNNQIVLPKVNLPLLEE